MSSYRTDVSKLHAENPQLANAYTDGRCEERQRIFDELNALGVITTDVAEVIRCLYRGTCGTWSAGECDVCKMVRLRKWGLSDQN